MPIETLNDVDWSEVDFIDLGCSNGGSIQHCVKRFGARAGIGIDIDASKVAKTRAAGYEAILTDARTLDLNHQVSFISMLDFIEHLPDLDTVEAIIAAAARSARDFIFIKHPSFEGQELVEGMGYRQYWWHWHGHTAHVRVSDYCTMLDRLGLHQYMIRYVERISDTHHPSIIPTSSPINVGVEAAAGIEVPELVSFDPPLWRRQDIFIALRPFEPDEWAKIVAPTARDVEMIAAGSARG